MKYDITGLDQEKQRWFLESIKNKEISDGYYKVFYDNNTNDFILVRIDLVVPNVITTRNFKC